MRCHLLAALLPLGAAATDISPARLLPPELSWSGASESLIVAADDPAEFAANPRARLHWFYERSRYHDEQYRRYPVLRSVE